MRMSRLIISASVSVFACVALVAIPSQRQGTAAASSGQEPSRGATPGGGQRGGGGGRAEVPMNGPGNLLAGVWGADPAAVDSRGWGWMTKSYVSASYKRPFYNKAKELLFSDKQVTSHRSARSIRIYARSALRLRLVRDAAQHDVLGCREDDRRVPGARLPRRIVCRISSNRAFKRRPTLAPSA